MKIFALLFSSMVLLGQPVISNAASRTVTLSVPGMTCAACPLTVKTALSRVNGVTDTKVSFQAREAAVTFDDAKTSIDALTRATAEAGYPSTAKARNSPAPK